MTKTKFAKTAVRYVVAYGTGIIVRSIIENNVPDDHQAPNQVAIAVASFAIGGAVSEAAGTYTDNLIDELVTAHEKVKSEKANRK